VSSVDDGAWGLQRLRSTGTPLGVAASGVSTARAAAIEQAGELGRSGGDSIARAAAVGQAGEFSRSGGGVRARVQHEDEGAGYFCKTASTGRGWRAVLCKMLSHLSLAFRFRSNVHDQSFHSLHKYPSFHLIWPHSSNPRWVGI
jgi:hypothetical protein